MGSEFKNVFLKPGTYRVGESRLELTAKALKRFAKNTNAMIHAGLNVPIFAQHTKPGDPNGGPSYDKNDSRNCVGRVSEIKVNADGSLSNRLNITNPDARRRVSEGSVQFTSPEIVKNFTDGKSRNWGECFRHFALTPTPRNPDQTALEPAAQFSLSNALSIGALQFSLQDMDGFDSVVFHDHGGGHGGGGDPQNTPGNDPAPVPAVEKNPDIVEPKADDKKLAAIIANLSDLGIELNSDFTFEDGLDALLASLKTLVAANHKAEKAETENQTEEEQSTITSEAGTMSAQFSEEHKVLLEKNTLLIAQLAESNRSKLVESLSAANLPPAMSKALTSRIETVQFAEDGSDEPSMAISEVIALFDESIPSNFRDTLTAVVEEPPEDSIEDDADSDEAAEKIYRDMNQRRWTAANQRVAPAGDSDLDMSGNRKADGKTPVDDPRHSQSKQPKRKRETAGA